MGAFLDRVRSPGQRAMRGAGPSDRLVIAAVVVGVSAGAVLWLIGADARPPWLLLLGIPAVLTAIIAVADRDGWRVREAIAYVALQQTARWTRGPLLRTTRAAEAWLAEPANADATTPERTSALIAAGHWAEAETLVAGAEGSTDAERASIARLRATIAAHPNGDIDLLAVRAAAAGLPSDERRYHVTAAAWSQVWLDLTARRVWRPRFAAAVRDLGPFPLPVRVRFWIAFQQLAAPIACVLAMVILAGALGR